MGLFDLHGARDAHEQIYGGRRDHDATHELLAGAAGFAVAEVDKHFDEGRYGHLDRHEAKKLAREQAFGLYDHRGW